jgi:Fur family ferric uptake transcriptional regulator
MVFRLLEASQSALSQDILEEKIKGKMDRVTIYRVLNRFCEDGIAHKIISDEGKYYYALCRSCKKTEQHAHDHIHFRCLNCQKVECLPNTVRPRLPDGYESLYSNYWISGYCNTCAKKKKSD